MNNSTDIVSAIKPVVDGLGKMGIKYFIGGSVASSILGVPRSTGRILKNGQGSLGFSSCWKRQG
jgi:hypothetical protein